MEVYLVIVRAKRVESFYIVGARRVESHVKEREERLYLGYTVYGPYGYTVQNEQGSTLALRSETSRVN